MSSTKNILIVLVLEILILVLFIYTVQSLIPFWFIGVFAINTVVCIHLLRNRPHNYFYWILALLGVFILPILFIFYELSQVQC